MKNMFLMALLCLLHFNSYSQKIPTDKVPSSVKVSFNSKYPTVLNVKWEMEENVNYEAEFHLNGSDVSAVFDKDGKFLSTESEIKETSLPSAIKTAIAGQFKEYEVEKIEKVEYADKSVAYEVEFEKKEMVAEVFFSSDGKIIKQSEHKE